LKSERVTSNQDRAMALMVKLQRPVLPTAASDQIDLKLEGV